VYKKILLVNPFGIGDVLFTTPVIRAIKDSWSAARIGYLCNRRVQPLLEANPLIDFVYVYERDEFAAARRTSFFKWLGDLKLFLDGIKKEDFDLALDFSLNTQFGFFCWYAGIKERMGYNFKGRGKFLTRKIKLTTYHDKHIVEYYAGLLKYLGLELKRPKLELYLRENDTAWAKDSLAKIEKGSGPLVAIIPGGGASWGGESFRKHWPAQNFAETADKIIESHQARVVMLGDSREKEITDKVAAGMRHSALNLGGKTSLGQMAAVLALADLAITNDGGPLHMAVALGIKTVSIFGPVDSLVYGPYPNSDKHIVVKSSLSCQPCYQAFRLPSCSRGRECINSVAVEEVCAAARKLL
jgi:lipopolysaccharide heptosyltransferase II